MTNNHSLGTDGAVWMSASEKCARCSGLGWVVAENSFYPRSLSCSACNGTGKADCAPIAGPAGMTERQYLGLDAVPAPPSPSKRDATEVRQYWVSPEWTPPDMDRDFPEGVTVMPVSDHAAAIARVEESCIETAAMYRRERHARREAESQLAQTATERDKWQRRCTSQACVIEAERQECLAERDALRSQLALQAEKVGRLRNELSVALSRMEHTATDIRAALKDATGTDTP